MEKVILISVITLILTGCGSSYPVNDASFLNQVSPHARPFAHHAPPPRNFAPPPPRQSAPNYGSKSVDAVKLSLSQSAPARQAAPAPQPVVVTKPAPAPKPVVAAKPAPAPAPKPIVAAKPAPAPAPKPVVAAKPAPAPAPKPVVAAKPAPAPAPVPKPVVAAKPAPAPAPKPVVAAKPAPAPAPKPVVAAKPAPAPAPKPVVAAKPAPAPKKKADQHATLVVQKVRREHDPPAATLQISRSTRQNIIASGKKLIGTPYRYGGTTIATGFDCSGLVQYVFKQNGIQVPRTSRDQFSALKSVKNPQPGDLVFFRHGNNPVNHVGIYIGNNQMLHAPSTGKDVRIVDITTDYWKKRYAGARQVPNVTALR